MSSGACTSAPCVRQAVRGRWSATALSAPHRGLECDLLALSDGHRTAYPVTASAALAGGCRYPKQARQRSPGWKPVVRRRIAYQRCFALEGHRLRHGGPMMASRFSGIPSISGGRRTTPCSAARPRWCLLPAIVCSFFLALSACGGSPESARAPSTSTSVAPTEMPSSSTDDHSTATPSPPSATPTQPDSTATPPGADPLADYRERCLEATRSLDEADVRFNDRVELTTGDRTNFSVTLQALDVAPTTPGDPSQGRVQIACTVGARLIAPSGGISISPEDWVSDKYLPPTPTTWTWLVTATDPGDTDALLLLRPAILVTKGDGPAQEADLGTVEFAVTFDVARSTSDTAGVAWKWIGGAVGLLVALLGIPAAYRTWRPRPGPRMPAPPHRGESGDVPLAPGRRRSRRARNRPPHPR